MRKPIAGQHHTPQYRAHIEEQLRNMPSGETPTALARRLGVNPQAVRKIYSDMTAEARLPNMRWL